MLESRESTLNRSVSEKETVKVSFITVLFKLVELFPNYKATSLFGVLEDYMERYGPNSIFALHGLIIFQQQNPDKVSDWSLKEILSYDLNNRKKLSFKPKSITHLDFYRKHTGNND